MRKAKGPGPPRPKRASENSYPSLENVPAASKTLPAKLPTGPLSDADQLRCDALQTSAGELRDLLQQLRLKKEGLRRSLQEAAKRGTNQDRAEVLEKRLQLLEKSTSHQDLVDNP